VPGYQTIFYLGWANVKACHILNLTTSILTPCSGAPNASGLPQAAKEFGTELTFGHHIQRVVDRFVGHPLFQIVRIPILECASDLFRGPALAEKVFNNAEQYRMHTQLGSSPRLKSFFSRTISSGGGIIRKPLSTLSS
jgi:hypothetical protein